MDASIIANDLHEIGFTDIKLCELLGCTREYVNKIRNGKKQASSAMCDKLAQLHSSLIEDTKTEGDFPWLILGVGVIIVIAFIGFCIYVAKQDRPIVDTSATQSLHDALNAYQEKNETEDNQAL